MTKAGETMISQWNNLNFISLGSGSNPTVTLGMVLGPNYEVLF